MDPRDPLTFTELADQVRAAPPRLGGTRLVCIDGPAGSGKTTFAGRLVAALGDVAALVHLEDLYAGWTLTGVVDRLTASVLAPLSLGRPGSYQRYDWHRARFAEDDVVVPPVPVLVVEGCGCAPRSLDEWTVMRVWVEAPLELRTERGLARDGVHLADEWARWQGDEAAEFAMEGTRARADLRVDGAASAELAPDRFAPLP